MFLKLATNLVARNLCDVLDTLERFCWENCLPTEVDV
jgi:hypothetical protein